jgi:hypothetical protein
LSARGGRGKAVQSLKRTKSQILKTEWDGSYLQLLDWVQLM